MFKLKPRPELMGQRRGKSKNILAQMKMKTCTPKHMRCNKNNTNREVHGNKKEEKSQINNLIPHLEEIGKEQTKPKFRR